MNVKQQAQPYMHWEMMFQDMPEPAPADSSALLDAVSGVPASPASGKPQAASKPSAKAAASTAAARESAMRLLTRRLAAEKQYLVETRAFATFDRANGYSALAAAGELRCEILQLGIETMETRLAELRRGAA